VSAVLKEHIGTSPVVTVIGLCKNAGKTTVLRQLLSEFEEEPLALTSVGRDGESTDLVTGTEKPSLYIKSGDLFATAHGMLPLCDVTCSVEALTGIMTPLGEVAVFRALSDGFVQLAGPSAVGQLPALTQLFFELGASRVLVDGAAGRKSLATAGVSGCTILCAGASFDRDMAAVAAETAHICSLFRLQPPPSPTLRRALGSSPHRFALFTPEGEPLPLPTDDTGTPLWQKLPRTPCALWVGGAVANTTVKALSRRDTPLTLITENPTHILADRDQIAAFMQAGGTLAVRQPLKLAAVCANPCSAYGWHFPAPSFSRALQSAISLPVINVLEGCQ